MVQPVTITVPIESEDVRTPDFVVDFTRDGKSMSWILTKDEAAQLAIAITGTLMGRGAAA